MIKRVAGVIVLLLLAAGCSQSGPRYEASSISVPPPGSTVAPSATDAAPQATAGPRATGPVRAAGPAATQTASAGPAGTIAPDAIRTPVKVGFIRTKVSNLGEFGINIGMTVSEPQVITALVDSMNAKGGLNGRQIVPVYSDTDTATASWETDFARACAAFTQDAKVEAVVGYVFDHNEALEACLSKAGVPHLSTTFNVPDTTTFKRYPTLFGLANPGIERRTRAKVDGALAQGILKPSSRVGIIRDECPSTQRAWSSTLKSYFAAKKVNVVQEATVVCAAGANDTTRAIGELNEAGLQFRTSNVTDVMFVSVSEGPALIVMATIAENQGWRPNYIVSSLANLTVAQGNLPPAQVEHVHGFGWLPDQDVNPDRWPARGAAFERCITLFKDKGISPQTAADYSIALSTCEGLFAYEAALRVTRGRSDAGSIKGAVEGFGDGYQSAIAMDGKAAYGPDRHDGPAVARYVAFDKGCTCFTYRGAPRPI